MFVIADRSEEFDEILHTCLEQVCAAAGRKILRLSEEAAGQLESYSWPGNLTELCRVLDHAVASSRRGEIGIRDLPPWFCFRKEE